MLHSVGFERALEQGSPEAGAPENLARMDDAQRASAFAETGDPRYLTPALAHEMGLGVDIMREVAGATAQDIERAQDRSREQERAWEEHREHVLQRYGLGYDEVVALSDHERAQRFLEGASLRVREAGDYETETVREFAYGYVLGEVLRDPGCFGRLFDDVAREVSPDKAFAQMGVLERIYEDVRMMYFSDDCDADTRQRVLLTMGTIVQDMRAWATRTPQPDANALLSLQQQTFARTAAERIQRGWMDCEQLAPFKVAPDMFAMWDADKDRINVHQRGRDALIDELFTLYESDTLAGKLLRRETAGLAPYELATVDEGIVDVTEAGADILGSSAYLEDFIPEAAPSPEDVEAFVLLHRDGMRALVRDVFHVPLEELHIAEQWHFLKFLKETRVREAGDVARFMRTFGVNGARAFLSLEHGGQEMGAKILAIGERYADDGVAQRIFAKYTELVDAANSVEDYLREQFGAAATSETVHSIQEALLQDGKDILVACADQKERPEDALDLLQRTDAAIVLFKRAVRAVREADPTQFSLKEIAHIDVHITSGTQVSPEDAVKMQAIYRENYEKYPMTFKDKLLTTLDERLRNPESRFYIVRDKRTDAIIAFDTFTPQEDGTVYFGNFNVNPQYQHSRIGEAVMDLSLEKEAQNATIVAHGIPDAAITRKYIADKRFVPMGEEEIAGQTLVRLVRERSN